MCTTGEERNFNGVKILVKTNQEQLSIEWPKLEQAKAISDVIIAAEKRLSNEFLDYYGMLRVRRFGDVVLDDFLRLMKLLDGRFNVFPFSQEAAHSALLAWSFLSKPHIKAKYDLAVSSTSTISFLNQERRRGLGGRGNSQREGGVIASQGGGFRSGGGIILDGGVGGTYGGGGGFSGGKRKGEFGGFGSGRGIRLDGGYGGGVDKGKEKMAPLLSICTYCNSMSERETEYKGFCFMCKSVLKRYYATTEMVPEKGEEMLQLGFPKDGSFIHKEQSFDDNVGRGSDNVIVVVSDDDSDEDQESVTIAQTDKLCRVNGKRVKLIPFKK
ncbi:unnamed protein product [Cochlearia groenlandica]